MARKCFEKLKKRYADARSTWSTDTIIGEIFDLSDSNLKNQYQINSYMHELKSRGSDAIYKYYEKYAYRVINEEVDIKHVNLHHALNEVLKLNEAEKIWNFVNILEQIAYDFGFRFDYNKCSKAMAKTGNARFNNFWAECHPECNEANIEAVIASNDVNQILNLLNNTINLSDDQIDRAVALVKKSKDKKFKQELREILKDKYPTFGK